VRAEAVRWSRPRRTPAGCRWGRRQCGSRGSVQRNAHVGEHAASSDSRNWTWKRVTNDINARLGNLNIKTVLSSTLTAMRSPSGDIAIAKPPPSNSTVFSCCSLSQLQRFTSPSMPHVTMSLQTDKTRLRWMRIMMPKHSLSFNITYRPLGSNAESHMPSTCAITSFLDCVVLLPSIDVHCLVL
jgi:hypothetical protein